MLRKLVSTVAFFLAAAPAVVAQSTVLEIDKLFPPDGAFLDNFSRDISISGNTALITALADNNVGSGTFYEKAGGTWTAGQQIAAATPVAGDRFGISAVLMGATALVGANADDDVALGAGTVYVFERAAGVWSETDQLYASDPAALDDFGNAVDAQDDVLIVGAPGKDEGALDSGAAYVFRRTGGVWSEEQKLTPAIPGFLVAYGATVGTDGQVIVVSASSDDDVANDAGAVYVYLHDGNTWNFEQKLTASDGGPGDFFGFSCDVDGDLIAVGANHHTGPATQSGATYVFRYDGNSWVEEQKLIPLSALANDNFGWSVDIDAGRIVAGAVGFPAGSGRGAAYQFHHDGNAWVEVQRWTTSDLSSGMFAPNLGLSIALDGATCMAGAPFGDGAVESSGAAYVFEATDLALDVIPNSPTAGATGTFRTNGGQTGNLVAVFVTSLAGAPLLFTANIGVFDADGQNDFTTPIPVSLSGLEATFVTAGFWNSVDIGFSNVASVTFQ